MPFWFWNDRLDAEELVRQIADFQDHGVCGFVIHPRIGLPSEVTWMGDAYLYFCRVAIEEAAKRNMKVMLYDEGMYPSGSSAGQVAAADPSYQARCLDCRPLGRNETMELGEDENLWALATRPDGTRYLIFDRKAASYIRGLHYLDHGREEVHLAADLLNPAAVAKYIELVYRTYCRHFGAYFGKTILGIFTDEPSPLARCTEENVYPGSRSLLPRIGEILGYDFRPHLLSLWFEDDPAFAQYRRDYRYAVSVLLNERYYRPLRDFCETHGTALTGHPAEPDNTGALKYFHIPGQDAVWRWILPDDHSALEGPQSTQAKCSASVMVHTRRRRNLNEFCGAYGSEMTWEEMDWLSKWLLIRGVNLLVPHAFYYSVRGQRVNERPPQVGPHAPWWEHYRSHANFCRRVCWLNTDSRQLVNVAVLGRSDELPWQAARVLYENQVDFNYLDGETLEQETAVDGSGIAAAGLQYTAAIVDQQVPIPESRALQALAQYGRLFSYRGRADDSRLVQWLEGYGRPWTILEGGSAGLRVRSVEKHGHTWHMLFNEATSGGTAELKRPISSLSVYDPAADCWSALENRRLDLQGRQFLILVQESPAREG